MANAPSSAARRVVYTVQSLYGAWFLFHGVNYFHPFFRQPPGTTGPSHELIATLIHTGLFAWVKVVEILVGLALLAHWYVPLAIVAAAPVTVVIIYSNVVLKHDAYGYVVGALCVIGMATMGGGYLAQFRPLLQAKCPPPCGENS